MLQFVLFQMWLNLKFPKLKVPVHFPNMAGAAGFEPAMSVKDWRINNPLLCR
jgi:hypothetical protein